MKDENITGRVNYRGLSWRPHHVWQRHTITMTIIYIEVDALIEALLIFNLFLFSEFFSWLPETNLPEQEIKSNRSMLAGPKRFLSSCQ